MMKANIVNPAAPVANRYSVYDRFVALHYSVFSVLDPVTGVAGDVGHGAAAFLAWHRVLLLKFEQALQAEVPGVMLPYWDWSPVILTPEWMGGNGGPGGVGGGIVESGWFAPDRPGTGANTVALPGWYPTTLNGWRIRPDLDDTGQGPRLRRYIGQSSGDVLPTASDVDSILTRTTAAGFRLMLESGSATVSSHNEVHRYIGGHMGAAASPNDPIFWLHHCNIDRLWAMWQLDGHGGTAWYPTSSAFGHQLVSRLWPWTGNVTYAVQQPAAPPVYTDYFTDSPNITAQEMLNHRDLGVNGGYVYDTEPVLGVALDRSFSMTGPTTDPFAGMSPTTKWELAKIGVQNLLTDCEAVQASREAYVTAGVQTFTTSGAATVVDPVLGAAYGLVKVGGTYSQVAVAAALATLTPEGSTPLAAAVTETHAEVVRPPANAAPGDDVRFLAVFTDGKETVAPLLSSIAAGQLSDTMIFGMGFGTGSDWNGVDYPTIHAIVSKGRPAPAGVTQVYMGDNVGAIDNFYTKTLAKVIGYTPLVDPRFDLFPGEHTHVPVWVTSADDSILITVFRGDADSANWHVGLVAPNGAAYHHSATSPYFLTIKHGGHRDTIVLNRNGVPDEQWVGQWFLHLAYGAHARAHAHADPGAANPHDEVEDLGGLMVMAGIWDLTVPVGAPPLRGPVFTNSNVAASKRRSTRLIGAVRPGLPTSLRGSVVSALPEAPTTPSSVVVQVFARTTLRVTLAAQDVVPFAGEALRFVVDIEGGKVDDLRALGRVVGPTRAASRAFREATIPLAKRKRFVAKREGRETFDVAAFLTEIERKCPECFAVRDEPLELTEKCGSFLASVPDTTAAGVYRAGVFVEGLWTNPIGKRERFVRVLSTEATLGIRIDPRMARPQVEVLGGKRLTVTFLAQDRFGNVVPPGALGDVSLRLGGRTLKVEHEDLLDGSHRLEARLEGKHVTMGKDGRSLSAAATCECIDGHAEIRANEPLRLSVVVNGLAMAVALGAPVEPVPAPMHHHDDPGSGHDHEH